MIAFRVEVLGAREASAALHAQATRMRDWSGALVEAGFLLLLRIWDRIAGKQVASANYSKRYVEWLIRHGDWSGKMVGILTGALIAQSAPAGPGASAGELGTQSGPDYVEVGFINPSRKAHGFLGWFRRKFGEEAIQATDDDQRQIGEIFDRWMAEGGTP